MSIRCVRYEDVFGAGGSLPSSSLLLSRQGDDVAFHVDRGRYQPGSTLYFITEGADANPYGNVAVYELQLSSKKQPGVRMKTVDATPWGSESTHYWKRDEQEVNRYHQALFEWLLPLPLLWLARGRARRSEAQRGVIAAFSPSGLSLNTPAQKFHPAMLDELYSGRHLRLGDAVLGAQQTYLGTGASPELLSIYHLFGDPAFKLR
jgi:hypothetical protein